MRSTEHIGIIGAGIVGLALARHIALHRPGTRVTVLEKENRVAAHQTGHNSGVVHAGLYYRPGSLKATLCRRGVGLLREYCAEHDLPYREVGKLLVAVNAEEEARLDDIERRAEENGVPGVTRLGPDGIRDIEPHSVGLAALHSPTTAITDYVAIAEQLADDLRRSGGVVLLNTPVIDVRQDHDGTEVLTGDPKGERVIHRFDRLIVCGGLQSDRLSAMAGADADPRIVPFRGHYHEIVPERRDLVRGLLYPVPDPRYPFLGVHLTRHVHGEVMAGPNAILATAREGYRARDLVPRELAKTLSWPGGWPADTGRWARGRRSSPPPARSSPPRHVVCFPRSPPPTCVPPRRGCAPRRSAGTVPSWTTSMWTPEDVWSACATRPLPRRPPPWRSPSSSMTGTSPGGDPSRVGPGVSERGCPQVRGHSGTGPPPRPTMEVSGGPGRSRGHRWR
ncbi:FAD dependent oxidoreductase [Nocardiopsis alba ATCC BAA-2165]|uniref:FAD dependent oxidoreductase n=1 Tax=Nocardiopsis alba (strain ATCC BAA-2165 / BE74) TaxID=1205910 RepID=J7L352_NOCAA|nr:FAD dependent oxidoreductase [Nocardiopsis alba ATCC BAA-2165]